MNFRFYKESENIRLISIAVIGAVIGFGTYEIIYYFNPLSPRTTSSWIAAFIIGVVRQHALHRWFTFRDKTSYFKSLYKAFVVDFGALLYSSVLSWLLSEFLNINHRLTWLICLMSSALISMVFLKMYIFKKKVA